MDIETGEQTPQIPAVMKFTPAVFAVRNEYQIMIPVKEPTVMWVQVGTDTYYDESNSDKAERVFYSQLTRVEGKRYIPLTEIIINNQTQK